MERPEEMYLKKIKLRELLFGGICLRLAIMPFTLGGDLLANYLRAAGLLRGEFIRINQAILHYLHAGFLFLLQPLLDGKLNDLWLPIDGPNSLLSQEQWDAIVRKSSVFQNLFFLKLPYFLTEIAFLWTISKLFKKISGRKRALVFWLFNPIVLYSLHIFGRHDILGILALSLAFLACKETKFSKAAFFWGLACALRSFPYFVAPLFFAFRCKNFREVLKRTFYFVLPIGVDFILTPVRNVTQLQIIDPLYHSQKAFMPLFEVGSFSYSPFFIFLTIIYLGYWQTKREKFKDLVFYSLAVFLAYFGIAYFHGHYLIWLMFFATLAIYYQKRLLPYFWLIFIFFPIILLTWDKMPLYRLTGLLTPIAPDFFLNLITPTEIIDRFFPTENLINLARSGFAGVSFYLTWLLLNNNRKKAGGK